jgi:membrane fusion protein
LETTVTQPLFRPEVITERQTQWLGTVLLVPRVSYRVFTAFAVLATGAMLALLLYTDYARKARINGWLVPQQGVIRVLAPQAGVITQLYVREGAEARPGQHLLMLSTELQSATLGATQQEVTRQLVTRRNSLAAEQRQHEQLLAQQMRALAERLAALQAEEAQLEREIALQQSRVRLAAQAERRQHAARARGLTSELEVQQAEENRLEQDARLYAMERSRMAMRRDRLTLENEREDLPFKAQAQLATLERHIAEMGQQLAEAEARREIVVTAPQSGIVTAIQAEAGGSVNTSVPLLSIVPAGTTLEAHLFGPSRAVGFVRPGQRVLLRYQAYPYQKFGHHQGVVTTISRSAVSPSEMPSQLAGLTSLYDGKEPVYRITARLESQTITAYGQPIPLQPGMQLEADVLLERRRLVEWVLDPLYTLTEK